MTQAFKEFHDAELVAIEIDRVAGSIILHFSLANAVRKAIRLNGVSHFRTVDLITQNVVSRLLVSSCDKLSSDDICQFVGWVTRLSDNSSFANDQQVLELQRRISQGELLLFALDPSWGAEIVIIAKSYSLDLSL